MTTRPFRFPDRVPINNEPPRPKPGK